MPVYDDVTMPRSTSVDTGKKHVTWPNGAGKDTTHGHQTNSWREQPQLSAQKNLNLPFNQCWRYGVAKKTAVNEFKTQEADICRTVMCLDGCVAPGSIFVFLHSSALIAEDASENG